MIKLGCKHRNNHRDFFALAAMLMGLLLSCWLPAVSHGAEVQYVNKLIRSASFGYGYGYAPSIIVDNSGVFHMFYCSSPASGGSPGSYDSLRYATSTDGLNWSSPTVLMNASGTSGGGGDGAICDPSVVKYQAPGDSQPYYYLFYSGNDQGWYNTLMYVARSTSINGPYAKWTTSGTWTVNATNPQTIIVPQHHIPNSYGAGEQTVVATSSGLMGWWGDSTQGSDDVLFASTQNPTSWPLPVDTHVGKESGEQEASSVDIKYDAPAKLYKMFYIKSNGGATSSLRERTSSDGIKWSTPITLCSTGEKCMPSYANNLGISGDEFGDLIQNRGLAVYGGAGADCGAELLCTQHYDLFGTIINPAGSSQVYSAASTDGATSVSANRATLNGRINPQGAATKYHFEYGTSSAYGTSVPIPDGSVGSGSQNVSVSEVLASLQPETTYYYRLIATDGGGSVKAKGEQRSFTTRAINVEAATASQLGAMSVTEPFDGSTGSLSNFSNNWTKLNISGTIVAKGQDTAAGWGPSTLYANGADGSYYNPGYSDSGAGEAAVATLNVSPGVKDHYFSLRLNSDPTQTKNNGYEARFTYLSTDTYKVELSRWVNDSWTGLATLSSYKFPVSNSFALVDEGDRVSIWTNTGSGFSPLLMADDATFAYGKAGVQGAGNATRLTNFRAGPLSTSTSGQLGAMSVTEPFDGSTGSLSNFSNNWTKLNISGTIVAKGQDTAAGWGPSTLYANGADGSYYNPGYSDSGAGEAAVATLNVSPGVKDHYFSLRLNSDPTQTKNNGYEARFTYLSTDTYKVELSRWVNDSWTGLATLSSYKFPVSNSFALVDEGDRVSIWTNTGSGFSPLLMADDATFAYGKAGVQGAGNATRLTNFRAGPLSTSTSGQLGAMSVTEPFDGSTGSLSNFSNNWTKLNISGTIVAKGQDTAAGWGPSTLYANGADGSYYNPGYSDSGAGEAAVATLNVSPGVKDHYFSLRLDAEADLTENNGYEARFTYLSTDTYKVELSKWQYNNWTGLATLSSYKFPVSNSFALVDEGDRVSIWTNTGSGFSPLLMADDATFAYGKAGVQGAGNATRLTNFRAGPLSTSTSGQLGAMSVTEPFDGSTGSLSNFSNNWTKLNISGTIVAKGQDTAAGWGPSTLYANGADGSYYNPGYSDSGAGEAAVATLNVSPGVKDHYFSLRLDAEADLTENNGYEARFTYLSTDTYKVELSKWQYNNWTGLATLSSYKFPVSNSFALVDEGDRVSIWTNTGSGFSPLRWQTTPRSHTARLGCRAPATPRA